MRGTKEKKETIMLLKLRLWKYRLYLTDFSMRCRQKRDSHTHAEKKDFWMSVKMPLLSRRGGRCEWCGATEGLQVHHTLPYGKFPEYENHPDNLMLLCRRCHDNVHRNPFLNGKLIREKAEELGVDWEAVYGNPPYK